MLIKRSPDGAGKWPVWLRTLAAVVALVPAGLATCTMAAPALAAGTTTTTAPAPPPGPQYACASLVTVKPAAAGPTAKTATAQLGTVRAALSGVVSQSQYGLGPGLSHPSITVWVGGKQVYKAGLAVPAPALLPKGDAINPIGLQGFTSNRPLCVARFGTTAAETGVMLAMYSGGAHCCTWVDTYAVRNGHVALPVIEQDLGNPGGVVQSSSEGAILLTTDNAFYYQFDAYAFSGAPVRILQLQGTSLANTTKQFPALISKDAKTWWTAYQSVQSGGTEGKGGGLGLLAPWVADQCLLGQGTAAWAKVNQLNAQGKLSGGTEHGPGGIWPGGSQYVKALHVFLTVHGYC